MGCAENRGLLTASGKWAAADERGGPVEACSRSRGCRDAGKSLGRGCPFERPDPAWLSPVPEIFYGHMPQFPKRTGEGALWVGWGKGCICYWPEGRPEAGKVGAGKTDPWTTSPRAKARLNCQNCPQLLTGMRRRDLLLLPEVPDLVPLSAAPRTHLP